MLNIHTIVTFTVFKKTYLKCISGEIHSVCLGFEMEVLMYCKTAAFTFSYGFYGIQQLCLHKS